jgi:acylphosphatase
LTAYRFLVSGRVQGVGYRYFVLRAASALGVCGFVRNLPDGRVEVVAEGPEPALGELEQQLWAGPAFATVGGVDRSQVAPVGEGGFRVR